jgi:hypothetical protein
MLPFPDVDRSGGMASNARRRGCVSDPAAPCSQCVRRVTSRVGLYVILSLVLPGASADKSVAAVLRVSSLGAGQFTSIQAALDAAAPGDTLSLLAGTYNQYSERYADSSYRRAVGWISKPVTVIGTPGARVTGPKTIDSWGFFSLLHDTLRFRDVIIRNMDSGIRADGTTDVANCQFIQLRSGITVGTAYAQLTVRDCIFSAMFTDGIWCTQDATASIIRSHFSGTTRQIGARGITGDLGAYLSVAECSFDSMIVVQTQASVADVRDCIGTNVIAGGLTSIGQGAVIRAARTRLSGNTLPGVVSAGIACQGYGQVLGDSLVVSGCEWGVMASDWGFARVRNSHFVRSVGMRYGCIATPPRHW